MDHGDYCINMLGQLLKQLLHGARRHQPVQGLDADAVERDLIKEGNTAFAENDFAAAEQAFSSARAQFPGRPGAYVGLGNVAAAQGAHAVAVNWFREALARDDSIAQAHNNLSLSLQALGDWTESWREAEWRFETSQWADLYPHRYRKPRWNGEDNGACRLYVHWEQGIGDIIQYLRFLPLAAQRVGRLIFEVPSPLFRLSSCVPNIELHRAVNRPFPDDQFDYYIPLLSLPHVLGLTAEQMPRSSYLLPPPAPEERTQFAKPQFGIFWRGSEFDVARRCELAELVTLESAAYQLVSLQVGLHGKERQLLEDHGITDLGSNFKDFGDTAIALSHLHGIVTIDSAVAHLAGAMGKTTWLLLNEPAAVRWMLDTDESLWYPSMKLIRKQRRMSWATVLGPLRESIEHILI